MKQRLFVEWLAIGLMVSGCGGSDISSSSSSSTSSSSSSAITLTQRQQAATDTANNNAACTTIQPFYWEVGDRSAALASASVGGTSPDATTNMLIASASKWLFGAYMVQLRNGQLTANDIDALTMRSGYTNFSYSACIKLNRDAQDVETVDDCFNASNLSGTNADFDPSAVGKFFYNGGHFQQYASASLGLAAKNNATLTAAIAAQVGQDFAFSYDSPQLAAGITTTAADYAFFLRKIISNQLLMHDYLGTHAVCTNPSTCPSALSTPIPSIESWHYSLAHWVEDDPAVGDGAFSSPGAFGFYPWIDASKTYYGVLARYSLLPGAYTESVLCGRKIRKAWLTGAAQ